MVMQLKDGKIFQAAIKKKEQADAKEQQQK